MIVIIYMRTVKKFKGSCQCWGSVTFWCGSGSGSLDPYHWLIDPTPFFEDLMIFLIFFSYSLPTGTSSSISKINFLPKFCIKILFCQALFQSAQDIYWKREGAGSGSGSVPLTNGSGSGRAKNMRILRIRIPNIVADILSWFWDDFKNGLLLVIAVKVQAENLCNMPGRERSNTV